MGRNVIYYTGAALCILMFAASSAQPISIFQILQVIQSTPKSYPTPLYTFSFCMEITNHNFTDSLLNSATQDYRQLYSEVTEALNIIFNCSGCQTRNTYRGVKEIQFSNNGSVIANCTILFQTIFINNVVIKFLFLSATANNCCPNVLEINREFTIETVTPIWCFPKSTTPMAKTTISAIRISKGVMKARTKPFTTRPQHNGAVTRTAALSSSITSQKLPLNTGRKTTPAKRLVGTNPVFPPTIICPVVQYLQKDVPGWIIALLVLACITILLLLILILLLCCWCCWKKHKKDESKKLAEHAPYERTSFKEYLPAYSPHTPQPNQSFPVFGEPELKKKSNHSGMYVVNPER